MFVDNSVLVGVDIVGKGAGRCSPKVRKELVLSIEGDDREGELLEDGSGRGGRGNSGDRDFDNRGWEILNGDVCEWDAVNDFLELKVDICILGFIGGGVLKLRA